ncbi:ABC-three component system middle component 1 [Paenibacillus prosopidis]|uniref:Uncharacterized protein n=1 Tax=Paenibacillus prosopidis TaxID=630520 RepID=A0A368W7V2_9BACL|nr:ABC-three component system middle component 1 [Paenibacillus prosopidis]RCW52062.1 hypothetical protein DFP97_101408 [Paenibacillus prosopidis]
MINSLLAFFEKQTDLNLESKLEYGRRKAVYISDEQMYAVCIYKNLSELTSYWKEDANHIAIDVQGRLRGNLHDLRWDMYMILLLETDQIDAREKKKIENDRSYFRKIVITSRDERPEKKLPIYLELGVQDTLLFEEKDFLMELKGILKNETVEILGSNFFESSKMQNSILLLEALLSKGKGEQH